MWLYSANSARDTKAAWTQQHLAKRHVLLSQPTPEALSFSPAGLRSPWSYRGAPAGCRLRELIWDSCLETSAIHTKAEHAKRRVNSEDPGGSPPRLWRGTPLSSLPHSLYPPQIKISIFELLQKQRPLIVFPTAERGAFEPVKVWGCPRCAETEKSRDFLHLSLYTLLRLERLSQFQYEMSLSGLICWTLGPQLVALFLRILETSEHGT